MWTIAVSGKKNLRIQKYPDTCGRGLNQFELALGTDSNRCASRKNTIFFPCDFVGIIFMAVNLYEGGVRVRGDAGLRCFWCGFSEIFSLTCGIAVFQGCAVCGNL